MFCWINRNLKSFSAAAKSRFAAKFCTVSIPIIAVSYLGEENQNYVNFQPNNSGYCCPNFYYKTTSNDSSYVNSGASKSADFKLAVKEESRTSALRAVSGLGVEHQEDIEVSESQQGKLDSISMDSTANSEPVYQDYSLGEINGMVHSIAKDYFAGKAPNFSPDLKPTKWEKCDVDADYTIHTNRVNHLNPVDNTIKDSAGYKFVKTFHNLEPTQLSNAILDINARKSWDSSIQSIEQLTYSKNNAVDVVKWISQFPPPMGSRTYTFVRKWAAVTQGDRKAYIILSRSKKAQKPNGIQNIQQKTSSWSLTSIASGAVGLVKSYANGTEVDFLYSLVIIEKDPKNPKNSILTMIYADDAKLVVPEQVIKQTVFSSIPSQLEKIEIAAAKYKKR